VFFPKDPSKGFCLSFKELHTPEFVNNQLGILRGSEVVLAFFYDDQVVKHFCGLVHEDTLTGEGKLAQSLASVPIMMLPPQFDMKEVVAAAAKKGSQTYGWRTETSINAKNILQFLGTVFKRAFSLSIPRVSTKLELITRLFPGFLFDRAITDKTMLAQLNDFVKSRPEDELFAAASYFTRERFSREGRVTC